MVATGTTWSRSFRRHGFLYLMLLLPILYLAVFRYAPMVGLQIAFKDFQALKGVFGSPWIGLENFLRFFRSFQFRKLIVNTLSISVYSLAAGFPIPIVLAISLNDSSQDFGASQVNANDRVCLAGLRVSHFLSCRHATD